MRHLRCAAAVAVALLLVACSSATPAAPSSSIPAGSVSPTNAAQATDEAGGLLAPVRAGQTLTVLNGYDNPPSSEPCPTKGYGRDHCGHQEFGLDLVPSTPDDRLVLAPVASVVMWSELGAGQSGCVGLRPAGQPTINLSVCHLSDFAPGVTAGTTLARGQVIGYRRPTDPWIHLSLNVQYDAGGKQLPQSAWAPVPFIAPNTLEGRDLAPDGASGGPAGAFSCLMIQSTNVPVGDTSEPTPVPSIATADLSACGGPLVTPSPPATATPPATTAAAIGGGSSYTCTLLPDGTVRCWGNQFQLGNESTTDRLTPGAAVSGITDATAIATGSLHACAILSDATVRCWGSGGYGALGDEVTTDSRTPVSASMFKGAAAIAAGARYTCAILSDGTVRCAGSDEWGQLGGVHRRSVTAPVDVQGITAATAIAAGNVYTCAILADGTVRCWGWRDGLHSMSPLDGAIPVAVPGIANATAVAAGDRYACALLADGTVRCWGLNSREQLGRVYEFSKAYFSTPVAVRGIADATAIAAGFQHVCALRSGGTVSCWGRNDFGQLGNGATKDSPTPVAVRGIKGATAIGAGAVHTCAILADGTVRCWGSNHYGELGDGTTTHSRTPVKSGP